MSVTGSPRCGSACYCWRGDESFHGFSCCNSGQLGRSGRRRAGIDDDRSLVRAGEGPETFTHCVSMMTIRLSSLFGSLHALSSSRWDASGETRQSLRPLFLSQRCSVDGSAISEQERITTTHLKSASSASCRVQLTQVTENMQHSGAETHPILARLLLATMTGRQSHPTTTS